MRKIVYIFLVLILLFSTTGIAVSKHFCGEILQSISVNDLAKSCCDEQDMPEDCCNNQVSLEKTEEIQVSDASLKLAPAPYILLYFTSDFLEFSAHQSGLINPVALFDSPPLVHQEIFILDQSFLL